VSDFMDLLMQIQEGNEEITDDLLKRLDYAATTLISRWNSGYDLHNSSEKEWQKLVVREQNKPEYQDLQDETPFHVEDLEIVTYENDNFWYLEACFESGSNVGIAFGTEDKIRNKVERLITLREEEGERAFGNEILRLRMNFLDAIDDHNCYSHERRY